MARDELEDLPDKTVYTFEPAPRRALPRRDPFDAAAFKFDSESRIALKQGTLYQVQDIKSVATPARTC